MECIGSPLQIKNHKLMIRVTVLVAVYNAEPFLPACLDSLLNQTMTDIQVVCVDDGSTDGSLSVLRQYAVRDERIEVYSFDSNHGQAYARNVALSHARGDLVCFLDADDWFSPDALQSAVSEADAHDDADCVLFDVQYEYADGHAESYPMPSFESLTGEDAFRMSLDWQIHGIYLVRTKLHQEYPYDDSCHSFSDDNTTRLHFLASRSVSRCQGMYHYRQHAASVTYAISVRRFDLLRANESMKRQLQQMNANEEVMRRWETQRLLTLVDLYMFYHCHAHELPYADRIYGRNELHRVWGTIERRLVEHSISRKFGYCLMPQWWMFRAEEWLYFTLRGLMGKNK